MNVRVCCIFWKRMGEDARLSSLELNQDIQYSKLGIGGMDVEVECWATVMRGRSSSLVDRWTKGT